MQSRTHTTTLRLYPHRTCDTNPTPPPCAPAHRSAGLSALTPVEGVKSLTAYSQQFAAELAPAAPALSE